MASGSIDAERLTSLRDELGDEEFHSIVNLYLEEASKRISGLSVALERGDTKTVKFTAHTLKGSSSTLGAKRMQSLCADLQEAAASDLDGCRQLVDEVSGELGTLRRLLVAADGVEL